MDQEAIQIFEIYLDKTIGLMARTRKQYCRYFKSFFKSWPEDQVITQDCINAYLQKHGNNSNVRGFVTNLLLFFKMNKEIELPPKSIKDKKKRIIRPIDAEDIKKLKKFFYKRDFKQGLIFDLIYQGALRISEIPTIRINSFNWQEWEGSDAKFCKLKIEGKGNKERNVKINSETMYQIIGYSQEKNILNFNNRERFYKSDQLLFKGYSEQKIYWIIKRGSKKVIGRDIRPHELRHCRANELLEKGAEIYDIKVLLGHSSIAITEIYLHRSEKQSLENIEKYL